MCGVAVLAAFMHFVIISLVMGWRVSNGLDALAGGLVFVVIFPILLIAHLVILEVASERKSTVGKTLAYPSGWAICGAIFMFLDHDKSPETSIWDLFIHGTCFALPGLVVSSSLGWYRERIPELPSDLP